MRSGCDPGTVAEPTSSPVGRRSMKRKVEAGGAHFDLWRARNLGYSALPVAIASAMATQSRGRVILSPDRALTTLPNSKNRVDRLGGTQLVSNPRSVDAHVDDLASARSANATNVNAPASAPNGTDAHVSAPASSARAADIFVNELSSARRDAEHHIGGLGSARKPVAAQVNGLLRARRAVDAKAT
jgi:hypothetical protein